MLCKPIVRDPYNITYERASLPRVDWSNLAVISRKWVMLVTMSLALPWQLPGRMAGFGA